VAGAGENEIEKNFPYFEHNFSAMLRELDCDKNIETPIIPKNVDAHGALISINARKQQQDFNRELRAYKELDKIDSLRNEIMKSLPIESQDQTSLRDRKL
jgi:hypothetical protein